MIYSGTHICGHPGSVNLYGPAQNCKPRADKYFSQPCGACRLKAREEEYRRNADAARAQGLPELTGSEKQVAWATTIRANLMATLERNITWLKGKELMEWAGQVSEYQKIIVQTTSARWFIENRSVLARGPFIQKALQAQRSFSPETQSVESPAISINEQLMVRPESITQPGCVEIRITERRILAIYERNDAFRRIVYRQRFRWSAEAGAWHLKCLIQDGEPEDRAVELAMELLSGGFAVAMPSEKTRDMVIRGVYEPRHTRWIHATLSSFEVYFEREDQPARSALSALTRYPKWSNPRKCYTVPFSQFEGLCELIRLYDFRVSWAARQRLTQERARLESAACVRPVTIKKEQKDGLKQILTSSRAVLSDLMDDEV